MERYVPDDARLRSIWPHLKAEEQAHRLAEAQRRSEVLDEVRHRQPGESERTAVKQQIMLGKVGSRSSYRRWDGEQRKKGLDGLVDHRMLAARPLMPADVRVAICTLRRTDPNFDVDLIVAHVLLHHGYQTSATKVKRVLKEAGLGRRPGPLAGCEFEADRRLELGGMKLVEAAYVQTGYLEALTQGVVEHVKSLPVGEGWAGAVDTSDRDSSGRFLSSYNERFRKGPEDAVGPGFVSVAVKRQAMDPRRLHVQHVRPEVVERKLLALLASPLVGGGRWDGIRVSRGALLEELCGLAYMPATLDLFTRELKYAGVSQTLWEVHARLWLAQTAGWGEARMAVVLYVDATTKPVWTRLFSQSTKVSSVGKVMPGIEQVAFHSGYGVPLYMASHSGRAPLVTAVPEMLTHAEEVFGSSSVGRIIVIDAEGNSVPYLRGLEQGTPSRAWATRLRESWVDTKRIFNRTKFQPYRDGDRVRAGLADFNDPDGGVFRMRVLEVERRTTGKVTYLGASTLLDIREWKPAQLANLYFDRWPNQEANFRAVNQAVGAKDVHGYGKQLVENVSVVTEIDELARKTEAAKERLEAQAAGVLSKERQLHEAELLDRRRIRHRETIGRRLAKRMVGDQRLTESLRNLTHETLRLDQELIRNASQLTRFKKNLDASTQRMDRTRTKLQGYAHRLAKLDSQRQIFAHDVELDSLFSLLKVGLVLLVTFCLKTYLGDARMAVETFLERVATLPGKLRITPDQEILTLDYNERDPEVMGLLAANCDAINEQKLKLRNGRTLRLEILKPSPLPLGRPPPPEKSRTGSGDRFHR